MDLILGSFADAEIETMSDADMDRYEVLLEQQDADILSWITGEQKIPAAEDTPLLRRIIASCGAAAN